MKINVFKEDRGETNIVALIVMLLVIVVGVVVFRPYINNLYQWILGLFS